MNRKNTIKYLRSICKDYDVKVCFRSNLDKDVDGEVDTDNETIFINIKASRRQMSQSVFHELGHIYCVRNGLWKEFHKNTDYSAIQSFDAENWIEHWAKQEWDKNGMRKLFGQYQFSYLKKNKNTIVEWIRKHFDVPKLL